MRDGSVQPRRRRAPFVLLEGATFLSGVGNGVALVAWPWLILERTGSPAAAGLVAAAAALPVLAASLLSGTVVDLLGRRRTAVISDSMSAASVAAVPLVDATVGLSVPVLVVLVVLGAVLDPAGVTARETMLPAAAGAARWRLERVNGIHEAVWGLAFLLGPAIGGLLILWVGAAASLWATAGGFICAVALIGLLRLPGVDASDGPARPRGLWHGTVEGVVFVWRDPLLRGVGLITVLLIAIYMPIEGVVLPVHFRAEGAPERFGLLIAAMAGGGVVGALAYSVWGPRVPRRTAFLGALLATTLALLVMAPLPAYPVMLLAGAVVGLAYGPVDPLLNYAMQTRTPEHLRGRVFGVLTASDYAAGPTGYLAAGPLVEWLGPRTAFIGLAVTLLVTVVAAFRMRALHEFDAAPAPSGARVADVTADPA